MKTFGTALSRGLPMHRRLFLATMVGALAAPSFPAFAANRPQEVLTTWYSLVLQLVRHTPTYSPPVASRALAYLGVTAYEAVVSQQPSLTSLAGQLNALTPLPKAEDGDHDAAMVLHAALSQSVKFFFSNTGPSGQRAIKAMERKLSETLAADVTKDVAERSNKLGQAIAAHVVDWSTNDGGAVVENMGFPDEFTLTEGPSHWVPTNLVRLQQTPLLPLWGNNRPFAMLSGSTCSLSGPPAYSEDPGSELYDQAMEVYETSKSLTPEQKTIARFWSDDPMLSPTPPGHWISIVLQIIDRDDLPLDQSADALMRVGVAVADGFIGCWQQKFAHDFLRPITYIRRVIDPKWEPLLITPPFPEFPSGHSTQSGAAATALTAVFGENFAFKDATHVKEGLAERPFATFWEAAEEAAMSRLYGGIHFRAANEYGLQQGRCIGAFTVALRTLS